jgi:DNA processing protein
MSAEVWQAIAAAEFPPQKGRALIERLDPFTVENLLSNSHVSDVERKRIAALSGERLTRALAEGVVCLESRQLPTDVQNLEGVPPAIFAWGDMAALEQPRIAIVGTRSASAYGKACAQKFAEAFVQAGVTVVSGGALGIDAAAHKGALAHQGRTIAVLAGGVDHVYPAVHGPLFRDIRNEGLLVSQFAIGSKPNEYKFLVRNNLIAALSQAVVVIEAPYKSGAIRTALDAVEYGRDVFVVPATIDMMSFSGSFNLIRDGATLVTHPQQVLDAVGVARAQPKLFEQEPASALGDRILQLLTTRPTATEFIVQQLGIPASEVLSELTMLELEGRVICDTSGYAIKP